MSDNIFEYAVANKLRFPYKGTISTEDLYDLSTVELDGIYKILKREEKDVGEESLLASKSNKNVDLSTKIEIVKFVVNKKLAQIEARKKAAENKQKKKQIMEIIASKQGAELQNKSLDELESMLNELG